MRNLFIVLAAFMLVACQTPVEVIEPDVATTSPAVEDLPVEAPPVATSDGVGIVVKNSLWQTIDATSLLALSRSSAAPSQDQVQAAIDAYNAAHTDDMLRLYEGEAPAIEEAPVVDVYIVHPVTYAVNIAHTDIPRALLIENAAGWRQDAYGQLLFIDKVPPAPIIVHEKGPYERYAIYAINAAGAIMYEDHCGYAADGDWEGGPEILAGGWRDADHYYETRRNALWTEVVTHPGWRLIEHQLYTEPEVTP